MTFQVGTRVRFTSDNLGTVEFGRIGFTQHTIDSTAVGEVVTVEGLPEGWIAVQPDSYPDEYVPAHPSMIEPVA